MYCGNCGSRLSEGMGFCPNCGSQVAPSGFSSMGTQMYSQVRYNVPTPTPTPTIYTTPPAPYVVTTTPQPSRPDTTGEAAVAEQPTTGGGKAAVAEQPTTGGGKAAALAIVGLLCLAALFCVVLFATNGSFGNREVAMAVTSSSGSTSSDASSSQEDSGTYSSENHYTDVNIYSHEDVTNEHTDINHYNGGGTTPDPDPTPKPTPDPTPTPTPTPSPDPDPSVSLEGRWSGSLTSTRAVYSNNCYGAQQNDLVIDIKSVYDTKRMDVDLIFLQHDHAVVENNDISGSDRDIIVRMESVTTTLDNNRFEIRVENDGQEIRISGEIHDSNADGMSMDATVTSRLQGNHGSIGDTYSLRKV